MTTTALGQRDKDRSMKGSGGIGFVVNLWTVALLALAVLGGLAWMVLRR